MASLTDSLVFVGVTGFILAKYAVAVGFQAHISLAVAIAALSISGFVMFGIVMNPTWHSWVIHERGNMSLDTFIKEGKERMMHNFLVEMCGNIAIAIFMCSCVDMGSQHGGAEGSSVLVNAIWAVSLFYAATILPNVHHYMWEERNLSLITFTEVYQWIRRVCIIAILVLVASTLNEEPILKPNKFNGPKPLFPPELFVATVTSVAQKWVPLVILTVFRFVLGFFWYGPLFGHSIWLPAMQQFKQNQYWPETTGDIPMLLVAGIICGLVQSVLLLAILSTLQVCGNIFDAVVFCGSLWAFFVLPTISVDLWEGKPMAISSVNFSVIWVEMTAVGFIGAIYFGS